MGVKVLSDPRPAAQNTDSGFVASERPLMFAYWGAMGGLPQVTLELAQVAAAQQRVRCTFSISKANQLFDQYAFLGDGLFPITTFQRKWRSVADWKSVRALRSGLRERFRLDKTRAFVSLAPHVWSPLVTSVIRDAGVRHVVVAHDAAVHPGDPYGLVNWWLLREAKMADHVVALSHFVARQLVATCGIPQDKISVLFHPDLNYGAVETQPRKLSDPLRVLFFGRIYRYKGLELCVDAVEKVRRSGVAVELGVNGSGPIGSSLRQRLSNLNATVVNRWLAHNELAQVFSRYDVFVASHIEASQSGAVATAFGAGLPVIATPTGGLLEQITPGVTGIIAESVASQAIAAAIKTLAQDRTLLERLRRGVAATRKERSSERFFDEMRRIALA
jgi:glycosyltransferase involved in cell wall biosynthesis